VAETTAEAERLLKQQKYGEAIRLFQRALGTAPNDLRATLGLGRAHYELHKTGDALRQYQKAVKLAPRSAEAYLGLGMCQQNLGRKAEARKAYEQFLQIEPKGARAADVRRVMERL
jgi:Flp pilus assembly protein TadD